MGLASSYIIRSATPGTKNAIVEPFGTGYATTANQVANGFSNTPYILRGIENIAMAQNQVLYQKNLIDAATNMDKPAQDLASKKLYCINNLNWFKIKSNISYIIVPIIIILILILINQFVYEIPIIMGVGVFGMISWYLFYGFFYSKYLSLYKWNKMLYNINITKELDIEKCF